MCGISGIVKFDGTHADRQQVHEMIAALQHRGPDGRGVHIAGPVGLGHARLSIIDVQGGAQPMSTVDGRLWITFNGEIFNYVELREELIKKGYAFTTRSDTEVILNAYREYGDECVNRFNGQWAFAIWDAERRRMFLSRDRMGVRPLFYTQNGDKFVFASEVKSLFACEDVPAEIDLIGLDQIFTFWTPLAPRTVFKDIFQLPPGYSMVVEGGKVRSWQYWSLQYEAAVDCEQNGEKTLAEELLSLLQDATRIRLRSDVPVGAYLSGGIDSTVTTALVKKLIGDRLRSFSVSFEDDEFDESSYQQEASAFIGTQHANVRCSYEDIARVFPQVVWHTEQPVIRTAPAPMFLLSQLVNESGFKVVLTGEGADEMFGGYDIFKEAKIRRFWGRNLDSNWRPLLLKRLYPYMENIQRQSPAYLKSFFRIASEDLASPFFSHLPRWELTAKLKMFFSDDVRAQIPKDEALAEIESLLPEGFSSWRPFHQAEYLEATHLLPGYILSSQGDRMAMAHSVEGRYPFLDHRVVEFGRRLSPRLKMKVLGQKHLLKVASDGLIPDSIRRRPKQPYRAPDGKSFFAPRLPPYAEDVLSPTTLGQAGIFDADAVALLLNKFKVGRANGVKDNMALVGILSTQLVVDQFIKKTKGRKRHENSLGYENCCEGSAAVCDRKLSVWQG
jgi:asparagine synthase (glutamine-hydrolysing)